MASSSDTADDERRAENTNVSDPIVVCMKWVALRPEIDALTGVVITDERWSGPSLADQAALEWALRLGLWAKADVHVVTVGHSDADTMLRHALAAGAAHAHRVHIDSTHESQPTSASVAALLASVVGPLHPALVLCGDWSLDRGSASVPSFLAAQLGLDAVCGLVGLEKHEERSLRVERRLDGGRREVLLVTGVAVLSVEGSTARLRRAPLSGVFRAKAASIATVTATPNDIEWEQAPQRIGPFRPRTRILDAPTSSDPRRRVEELTGAHTGRTPPTRLTLGPDEAADEILRNLHLWGQLPS